MLKQRCLFGWLALFLLVFFPVQAQNVLPLLDIEVGVRALGMGGAFVGVADDESTAFANPAGLASLRAMAFDFNVENRFGRASYGGVSFSGRNLAAGVLFLRVSDIVRRNDIGDNTGKFDYTSLSGYASVGATLRDLSLTFLRTPPLDNISVGARMQIYRVNTLARGNGVGLTISPAFLFDVPLGPSDGPLQFLRVGAIVENLLPIGITYGSGHNEPWRIGVRLGASVGLLDSLILAAEIETTGIFHLGAEYRFNNLNTPEISDLAIRAGTILLRGGPMLTLGVGTKLNVYEVNYAFTGHPQLPGSHRLSFTARFANQTLLCLFTGFHDVGICDP